MKSAKRSKSAALQSLQQTINVTPAHGNSRYNDDYPIQAYKLCLLGATNAELASFFDVSKSTIGVWRKFHSSFNDAIQRGKKMADMEVAHSLYQATLDRIVTTRQAIKCKEIFYDENGKRVEKERIEVINVEKHIPADFRSQQFWLRSRNPKMWSGRFDDADEPQKEVQLNLGTGHKPDDDETGAKKDLIKQKYEKKEKDREQALKDFKLDQASQVYSQMGDILGKQSKAGKAFAAASALIDTYKAANLALASSPPPFNYVAAAAVVASGLRNVAKIKGSKEPKMEQGGLVEIGGKRHSQGGTVFTGTDGTRFEAEQGELIGVMNRNAAQHFMAFNNAFPAGGATAPNYFANGGIVSRTIQQPGIDADDLASKLAAANSRIPAPVVAVQDIVSESNSYVSVRQGADF